MGRWQRKAERQIGRETAGNEQIQAAQLQQARDERNDAISGANSGAAALQALIGQQLQSVRSSRLKGHDRRSAISRLKSQKVQAASQAPYMANQARGRYQERAQALDLSALGAEVSKGQAISQRTVALRQERRDLGVKAAEEAAEAQAETDEYRSLGYDEGKYGADELTAARAALDSGLSRVRSLQAASEDEDHAMREQWDDLDEPKQEAFAGLDFGNEEHWYTLADELGKAETYPGVDAEDMRRAVYERLMGRQSVQRSLHAAF
jgi:hypothetical protein